MKCCADFKTIITSFPMVINTKLKGYNIYKHPIQALLTTLLTKATKSNLLIFITGMYL